jgi:hypothetical protein
MLLAECPGQVIGQFVLDISPFDAAVGAHRRLEPGVVSQLAEGGVLEGFRRIDGMADRDGMAAGKTDPVSNAIGDRLTAQFSQRYDETNALKTELQASADAVPLPDSDLTLIDELPYAPGLLAHAPDDLRERLAAAFAMQAVYRQDTRQATLVLTITDTTPAIINTILADPRIDHDTAATPQTGNPGPRRDTSVDVSRTAIAPETADKSPVPGVFAASVAKCPSLATPR